MTVVVPWFEGSVGQMMHLTGLEVVWRRGNIRRRQSRGTKDGYVGEHLQMSGAQKAARRYI